MSCKLSAEEPQAWAALGQRKWSLKSFRFTPSVVFYLVLCKHKVVVLNVCQWEFNKDSYSVQITVLMVLELDYSSKKKRYCRTFQFMLRNIVKTELYLSNEKRTYCSTYYNFSTYISSLSAMFWISLWLIISANWNLVVVVLCKWNCHFMWWIWLATYVTLCLPVSPCWRKAYKIGDIFCFKAGAL